MADPSGIRTRSGTAPDAVRMATGVCLAEAMMSLPAMPRYNCCVMRHHDLGRDVAALEAKRAGAGDGDEVAAARQLLCACCTNPSAGIFGAGDPPN